MASLKTNRTIVFVGRKVLVWHLAKGPQRYGAVQLSRQRKLKVTKANIALPWIGQVALFITKTDTGGLFLISNALDLAPTQAMKLYAERFTTETFHRDMKQYLRLGELWRRSWNGSQRHLPNRSMAYNTLQFWDVAQPEWRRKTTPGQIVRYIRNTGSIADACHVLNQLSLTLAV